MPSPGDSWRKTFAKVEEALARLSDEPIRESDAWRRNRRSDISRINKQIDKIAVGLDPTLRPTQVFDPSQPDVAGHIVAMALVAQARHSLTDVRRFYGSGAYALYYNGDFPAYQPLVRSEQPIYVGKAKAQEPSAKDAVSQGTALYERLILDHAKNIGKAQSTLNLDDFECRFLVVQTGFETAAEDYLIRLFTPIWNNETGICHGLGKHGDLATTRANRRSPWDTLHPGRSWADAIADNQKPAAQVTADIARHFRSHPPRSMIQNVLDEIVADLKQFIPADPETADQTRADSTEAEGGGAGDASDL